MSEPNGTSPELKQLRELMKQRGIDAFIVESGDRHQSEYIHESDMRRKFISKFTGSAGTAVILRECAYLWTDGRYFLQAGTELSFEWTLMKSGQPGVLEPDDFLSSVMMPGETVAVDPYLINSKRAAALITKLGQKGIHFRGVDSNPVDEVWAAAKPGPPSGEVRVHPMEYAGVSHTEKIAKVQAAISAQHARGMVFSALDEIAWLLNIRGNDIDFNPVIMSYAFVTPAECHLFILDFKLTPAAREHLEAANVIIHTYHLIHSFLKAFVELEGSTAGSTTTTTSANHAHGVLYDPAQLSWALKQALGDKAREFTSPITLFKSIKNAAEIEGLANAHLRDGVALTAFLQWLQENVTARPGQITEHEACNVLESYRRRVAGFVCPSFETIAGYGTNGAIIHYHCDPQHSAPIGVDSFFLLDSGGQYVDGTTDVTRTVHYGTPTAYEKQCYTAVMKGHIDLGKVVFPEDTVGSKLDPLARLPLWTMGLDYNHGTGHGVGAFLNVHEGPQGISFRKRENEVGFKIGMTTSNEPGYYEDGAFGIRIENVCVTERAPTDRCFGNKTYCRFRTFTLTPYQTSLLQLELLDDTQLKWLNDYHEEVRNRLLPLMTEIFPEAVEFLVASTAPLSR